MSIATGEGRDKFTNVLLLPHGERRQLQAGDPALGANFERASVFLRKREFHDVVEEGSRLPRVKRRSAARNSVSWPRARSRANASGGSARPEMIRCICGGICSSRNPTATWIGSASTRW